MKKPNSTQTQLQAIGANDQQRSHLVSGTLQLHVAVLLQEAFRDARLTKASLAQRMDISRARVGQILDGEPHNFTLDLIGRAAGAMGLSWHLSLRDFWSHQELYTVNVSPVGRPSQTSDGFVVSETRFQGSLFRLESSRPAGPIDGGGPLVATIKYMQAPPDNPPKSKAS
jgi:transcriptional regulator with XRE-family HTH domain